MVAKTLSAQAMVTGGLLALTGVGLGLGAVSWWGLDQVTDDVGTLTENIVPSMQSLGTMAGNTIDLGLLAGELVLSSDAQDARETDAKLKAKFGEIDSALKNYEPMVADDKERVLCDIHINYKTIIECSE